jgi:hypothetical protein
MVSLLAVPWAYTLFDDMRGYFKRLLGGVLIERFKKPAADSPTMAFTDKG